MEITKEEILNEWLRQTDQSNIKEGHRQAILEAMEEYADAKCKSMVSSSNVSDLLNAWEAFKKANWWDSEAIDVEKVLIKEFSERYSR